MIAALISLLLVSAFMNFMTGSSEREISYNEFIQMLDENKVASVTIDSDRIYIQPKVEQSQQNPLMNLYGLSSSVTFYTGKIEDNDTLTNRLLEHSDVEVKGKVADGSGAILGFLLTYVFPFLLMWVLLSFLFRKMSKGGGPMGVGKSNAKVYVQKETGITFKDVAGEDEAKELLSEMLDYLKEPDKYTKIGAHIPKGALLVGPPGTGKTLLAKAVAGEANVPFFSIAGSEFVEMFVGMGAAKVRDLFEQAKKKSPCIIFIDEIDAIGKKRGNGAMGGNDEREQTLNQLLTEMDGFDSSKAIIILAATNQPDSLDPALLRPGRFDRRVPVELPDFQGRVDILKVHSRGIKMADNVDLSAIAKAAAGASGAELANIINEAALRAVRAGRERVIQSDLEESIEVVIAGYQKKNNVMTDKEKLIVSYHEVGHALVAALQKNSAPVQKITIIPRTSGALGYTMQVEDEGNHYLYSKEELENKIATLTGGRCAEELIFHTCTTGASNDIEQATKYARAMITRYGMADGIGMVAMEQVQNQYLGGDASLTCSPETQTKIDQMTVDLVKKQHDKAYQLLSDNITKLHEITKYLYEKETITGAEFMEILNRKEIDPSVVAPGSQA